MDHRIGDWGSIHRMMWYFPLAMMSFLALVFTQHHYNSKAWTWTCPSNAKVPSRDGTYARHRDRLCLLCVSWLCSLHVYDMVMNGFVLLSLFMYHSVLFNRRCFKFSQWSTNTDRFELPTYLLLQRREFPLPVPSHEVSHAHDFNVIWGLYH